MRIRPSSPVSTPGAPLNAFTLFAALTLLAPSAGAQEADQLAILRDRLQADLETIVEGHEGVAGLHVIDLSTGDRFAVRDDFVVLRVPLDVKRRVSGGSR